MDKDKILEDIFNNDPLGLLDVKTKNSNSRTIDERLLESFNEINKFVDTNRKEPSTNSNDILEFKLYSRLKSLKEDKQKVEALKEHDIYNILPSLQQMVLQEDKGEYNKPKEINTIDDLLNDDSLNILEDDSQGLFDFKHTPKEYEKAKADFVARRKACKNFDKYEKMFKEIQKDLANGKRKLIDFNERQLVEGNFFVHNGIVLFLEKIYNQKKDQFGKEDGRTRIIFENGTESGMKLRSLGKNLFINGRGITINIDKVNENLSNKINHITEADEEAGFIYVLKSKSTDEKISSITNLYKIGYSKEDVEKRIKNAEKEPTYLMAPVIIQGAWKCFNMNPQKLEQLLHNFFGASCLEVDIFDENGKRHTPREWFIAPLKVIEQAIELIINGKIIDYKYDTHDMIIVEKEKGI